MTTAIIETGVAYGDIPYVKDYDIVVTFDDSIIVDKESQQQKAFQEVISGLMSKEKYLKEIKGYSDEEVKLEMERLNNAVNPDPTLDMA